ncbi:molybdenum ABC transporter ATP-binding protein [Alkalilimnicola ehrlichii]|uniref:Molybdenum ABC transporter ATP-binding protein n=1 Tax=Alkalilimnicola ehrlichii TaxID=351052 RepID=A0A3E0X0U7_9GAMM|nr:molybdenum ABC transporter ATP-binding protein [Alkalilimnicola ehrlichii]RFA30342.1 molybdenum ABC transporter ATP-binding protein [Alkalilimnicola ehrlichii]RFA37916.1 molybdenum ABC transporter ATP-binding protein [Alkalilimnicola ehrlichii]
MIDFDFHLERGAFTLQLASRIPGNGITALFGRSGCGKTTLLRCIAGLERRVRGHLHMQGEVWQDQQCFLRPEQRAIGYVFQEGRLFPHLSVQRNLEYGLRRIPASQRRIEFAEVVELLGLRELVKRLPNELSGGQRQRVAIGRALLTCPQVLLMDEPLAALDAISKAEIMPYLERLHGELAIPVLLVSHSLEEVSRLADHMLLLDGGRLRAEGPLLQMLTRTDLPLAHSDNASAVLEAKVLNNTDDHMSELVCGGGHRLLISRENVVPGQEVRARILARDVAVALEPPTASSVSNCLPVRILEISDDPHPGHVLLRLDLDGQALLSRITRRSRERLALAPDMKAYALIKGITLN